MEKVIVIVGPTGVGKTKLSIELAKKYNGEIINGDSMQVYKEMSIGTAKIKEEEKEGIPHHLFSILSINESNSIYEFQSLVRNKIKEIALALNEAGRVEDYNKVISVLLPDKKVSECTIDDLPIMVKILDMLVEATK